jgi:hypothetical protein
MVECSEFKPQYHQGKKKKNACSDSILQRRMKPRKVHFGQAYTAS